MATAESSFIRFCQRVASFYPEPPYWLRNVSVFDAVFKDHKDDENLSKPILRFIDTYRSVLETPLFLENDEVNDSWLDIPEGTPFPVPKKPWSVCQPRGILLSQKKDDYTAVLPLSEVYLACQDIVESDRTSFQGFPTNIYVVKFFHLFYEMLHEAEPDNTHFQDNATLAKGLVGSSSSSVVNIPDIMPDLSKLLGGSMEGLLDKVDDSSRDMVTGAMDALKEGDFQRVFSSVAPMLEKMQQAFSGMSIPNVSNTTRPSSEEQPQIEESSVVPEDQS